MKTFLLATALAVISSSAFADTYVNGYYKNNGTYVQPHYRSSPNGYSGDNWSVKPNVNPYTGQRGTHNPTYGGSSYGGNNAYEAPSYGSGTNFNTNRPKSRCTGYFC